MRVSARCRICANKSSQFAAPTPSHRFLVIPSAESSQQGALRAKLWQQQRHYVLIRAAETVSLGQQRDSHTRDTCHYSSSAAAAKEADYEDDVAPQPKPPDTIALFESEAVSRSSSAIRSNEDKRAAVAVRSGEWRSEDFVDERHAEASTTFLKRDSTVLHTFRDDWHESSLESLNRSLPSPVQHSPSGSYDLNPVVRLMNPNNKSDTPLNREVWEESFHHMIKTDPLQTFLHLHSLPSSMFSALDAHDFDELFKYLLRIHTSTPDRLEVLPPGQAEVILRRFRRHMEQQPWREFYVKTSDKKKVTRPPAPRFRGRRLANFLRLCFMLNCNEVFHDTVVDCFPRLLQDDWTPVWRLERVCAELMYTDSSSLVCTMFCHSDYPHSGTRIPVAMWTSRILHSVMYCHLRNNAPSALPPMFAEYLKHGGVVVNSHYVLLIQAFVAMGQTDSADSVLQAARSAGYTHQEDVEKQNLAVLRGQRALGMDENMEKQILISLNTKRERTSRNALHRLMELRLDMEDIDGVKRLLAWFDINLDQSDHWIFGDYIPIGKRQYQISKIRPNATTFSLAMRVMARQGTPEQIQAIWGVMRTDHELLVDGFIAQTVKAMANMNLLESGFKAIEAHLRYRAGMQTNNVALDRHWTLPPKAVVGIKTLNAMLRGMGTTYGLPGLQRVMTLFRIAPIRSDHETMTIFIDFIRREIEIEPARLAQLAVELLDRSSNVSATVGHIDALFAHALRWASKQPDPKRALVENVGRSGGDILEPGAGLVGKNLFGAATDAILKQLRKRGMLSSELSFANRLHHDTALSQGGVGTEGGSSSKVWAELADYGFQPKVRYMMAILQGHLDANQAPAAAEVLRMTERLKIPVTVPLISLMLRCWIKAGDLRRAKALYDFAMLRSEAIRVAHDRPLKAVGQAGIAMRLDLIKYMLSAYNSARLHLKAAYLVERDILTLPKEVFLDAKTMTVAVESLRWTGKEVEAINLYHTRREPVSTLVETAPPPGSPGPTYEPVTISPASLGSIHRRLFRKIRIHLTRSRTRLGEPRGDLSKPVAETELMLDADREARPEAWTPYSKRKASTLKHLGVSNMKSLVTKITTEEELDQVISYLLKGQNRAEIEGEPEEPGETRQKAVVADVYRPQRRRSTAKDEQGIAQKVEDLPRPLKPAALILEDAEAKQKGIQEESKGNGGDVSGKADGTKGDRKPSRKLRKKLSKSAGS